MTRKTINEEIENIANRMGCELTKFEGKFNLSFDIRNLDFVRYMFKFNEDDFELKCSCEVLAGTSDKPSYLSGNTAVQNRFSLTAKYFKHRRLPIFSIYESGLIDKLLHKKYVAIKSKDKDFCNHYGTIEELQYLEERVKNSAEISPAINCEKFDDISKLTILFQSFSMELELYEKMIKFAIELNTEYNTG